MNHGGRKLVDSLHNFALLLRQHEINIDPSRLITTHQALNIVGLERRRDFKQTLKTTLISTKKDYPVFDKLFDKFWENIEIDLSFFTLEEKRERLPDQTEEDVEDESNLDDPEPERAFSKLDSIRHVDINEISTDDVEKARELIKKHLKLFLEQKSLRFNAANRGKRLDMRKLLKQEGALKETLRIPVKRKKDQKARLFVYCDISGSMDRYSLFFLHVLYVLRETFKQSYISLFSTRTIDATEYFKSGNIEACFELLSNHVSEWSSGTKLGECLETSMDIYAQKMYPGRSISLIISDGWDTGDQAKLENTIKTMREKSRTIIWLNPLLGDEQYQPICRGIATCLPYIDAFLPAHNIDSLLRALEFTASELN